jgi:hypothetical protein
MLSRHIETKKYRLGRVIALDFDTGDEKHVALLNQRFQLK